MNTTSAQSRRTTRGHAIRTMTACPHDSISDGLFPRCSLEVRWAAYASVGSTMMKPTEWFIATDERDTFHDRSARSIVQQDIETGFRRTSFQYALVTFRSRRSLRLPTYITSLRLPE